MRNKAIAVIFTAILAIQLSGCGLVLHPERKGQRGGNIDPAIAVLNAAGLFLFIVPGLVAFGIDLYYGTIYLPGTALELDEDELNQLKDVDGQLRSEALARLVSDKIGRPIDANAMVPYEVSSADELSFLVNHASF
ncbi:hypothetical protein [uncultured Photobacterium sp.]|uniref:hypothetical protein n=1 Tax=uncultured Photobacterium sp. TaxID=173973 RepID=UPI002638B426|nr:hypothetical protein [uncultured Photobacterium sp.]